MLVDFAEQADRMQADFELADFELGDLAEPVGSTVQEG